MAQGEHALAVDTGRLNLDVRLGLHSTVAD
jgi:hypothetical protein